MKKGPVSPSWYNDERSLEFLNSGKFSLEVRDLFRCRRMQMGLSYYHLSKHLGVNWSTVRKWETGQTSECTHRMRPIVDAFLKGAMDDQLRGSVLTATQNPLYLHLPEKIILALERMSNTYLLCSKHPRIRKWIEDNLNVAASLILRKLLVRDRYARQRRNLKFNSGLLSAKNAGRRGQGGFYGR
jgi:hypothetical protein